MYSSISVSKSDFLIIWRLYNVYNMKRVSVSSHTLSVSAIFSMQNRASSTKPVSKLHNCVKTKQAWTLNLWPKCSLIPSGVNKSVYNQSYVHRFRCSSGFWHIIANAGKLARRVFGPCLPKPLNRPAGFKGLKQKLSVTQHVFASTFWMKWSKNFNGNQDIYFEIKMYKIEAWLSFPQPKFLFTLCRDVCSACRQSAKMLLSTISRQKLCQYQP